MSPCLTKERSLYASPYQELTEWFREGRNRRVLGGEVACEQEEGGRTFHFQFTNVLAGADRVLDVRLSLDSETNLCRWMRVSESQEYRVSDLNAVLAGGTLGQSISNLAARAHVPYAIYLDLDPWRRAFSEYNHYAVLYAADIGQQRPGRHISVDLDWRKRSRAKAFFMAIPYVVTIPIDIVQWVLIAPIDTAILALSGGHGKTILGD